MSTLALVARSEPEPGTPSSRGRVPRPVAAGSAEHTGSRGTRARNGYHEAARRAVQQQRKGVGGERRSSLMIGRAQCGWAARVAAGRPLAPEFRAIPRLVAGPAPFTASRTATRRSRW